MNLRSSYISGPIFLENFMNFCMYDVQKSIYSFAFSYIPAVTFVSRTMWNVQNI